MFVGQVKSTAGAAVTVKVRVQVTGAWQLLVAVNVTVELPPQALGAPGLLLVKAVPHPPVTETDANQAAYLVSIAACV